MLFCSCVLTKPQLRVIAAQACGVELRSALTAALTARSMVALLHIDGQCRHTQLLLLLGATYLYSAKHYAAVHCLNTTKHMQFLPSYM